jgi:hypothetical protein
MSWEIVNTDFHTAEPTPETETYYTRAKTCMNTEDIFPDKKNEQKVKG